MSLRLGSLAGFAVVVVCAASAAAQSSPPVVPVLEPTAEPPPASPSPCDEFSCYKRAVLDGNRFAAVGQDYTGVYVFARDAAGAWVQEAVLPVPDPSVYACSSEGCQPPDPMEFDPDFGLGLALDGDDLLVSHVHYDQASDTRDARVYVFHRFGSTWRHTQTIDEGCFATYPLLLEQGTALLGTCAYARTWFGRYRFVQELQTTDGQGFGFPGDFDGRTAVFGAFRAAYVFERFRYGWRQVQKLEPTDPSVDTGFGLAVAVSGDTIAVGAPQTPSEIPERTGVVHVYTRRAWGFRPTQVLSNPYPYGESEQNVIRRFGTAVAVDSGRLLASGETLYPFADPLPMNYLYQARWGRFAPTAALAAGGAHSVSIDRRWALVDSDGLRTGTYPVLFALP